MTDKRIKLSLILALNLLLLISQSLITAVHSSPEFSVDLLTRSTTLTTTCTTGATIGECLDEADEFELDSEEHRRMLAQRSYISYGALNRNRVPCSRRGASYYNCRPGAQANPYHRGCSAIARCRRT